MPGRAKTYTKTTEFEQKVQDSAPKYPCIAPLKGLTIGRIGGDLGGNSSVKDVSEKENDEGFVRADEWGEMSGKVAEIESFAVGNHAGNGHLSADKVTKCSDIMFVLKKATT